MIPERHSTNPFHEILTTEQAIFANESYAKPFFLTYLNTANFVVLLIPQVLKGTHSRYRNGTLRSTAKSIFTKRTLRLILGREKHSKIPTHSEGVAFFRPDDDDENVEVVIVDEKDQYLDVFSTARLALAFCFLWYGANYFQLACLEYTTVASTTILTSTASVWTLLIGTLTGSEKFTWRKFFGVVASLGGIVLISGLDSSSGITDDAEDLDNVERGLSLVLSPLKFGSIFTTTSTPHLSTRALNEFPDKTSGELLLGDALALFSAMIYGLYSNELKRATQKAFPLDLHMPTFFGLVGLINIVLLWPIFIILHVTGVEVFEWPPTAQIWGILVANSVSSLVSDVIWAYAMVFTSPLVVTLGLSLTIPLSLIGEMLIQSRYEGWLYWLGAFVVVGSFVFVDREEVKEEEEQDTHHTRRGSEVVLILDGDEIDVDMDVENGTIRNDKVGLMTDKSRRSSSASSTNSTYKAKQRQNSEDLEGLVFHDGRVGVHQGLLSTSGPSSRTDG